MSALISTGIGAAVTVARMIAKNVTRNEETRRSGIVVVADAQRFSTGVPRYT